MRAALVAALVTGVAACGPSKGANGPGPIAGRPSADPAAQLLTFVPPDASFVFVRDQQAGVNDQFNNTARLWEVIRGFRATLDTRPGTGQAFGAALLDELLDSKVAQLAGWREGESVMVMYGLGFDTVVRATLDGAKLRATIERAAATSGYPLTSTTANGRALYRVEIPAPAFTIWLLLAIDDHGVVAAFTGDPDRLTEHVVAASPTGPRYDTAAVVAAAYPDGRPNARFSGALHPSRLADALGALVARRPSWLAPFEPCAAAAVGLLAATPSVRMGWVPGKGTFEAVFVVDASASTVERLGRAQRALPRWREGDGRMRLGLGVGPTTLVDVVEPWFTTFDSTASACGGGGTAVATLRSLVAPAPMALIDAAVVEWNPKTKGIAAAVVGRDLAALWASLRGMLPLRPQPPAPRELVTMPGAVALGATDALGFGVGDSPTDAVTELLAASPGPPAVLSFEMGRDVLDMARAMGGDDGTFDNIEFDHMAMHTRVRDRQLVIEMRALAPASPHQLAH